MFVDFAFRGGREARSKILESIYRNGRCVGGEVGALETAKLLARLMKSCLVAIREGDGLSPINFSTHPNRSREASRDSVRSSSKRIFAAILTPGKEWEFTEDGEVWFQVNIVFPVVTR